MSIEKTIVSSVQDHIRKYAKSMWQGSSQLAENTTWIIDDKNILSKYKLRYPHSLYKSLDEIIVNASDQAMRNKSTDMILIDIDEKTGKITVNNNGEGIPVYKLLIVKEEDSLIVMDDTEENRNTHESYESYWNPQVIANYPLSGTNIEERKHHITGGVNGIGLKIVCYNSDRMELTTIDTKNKLYYNQVFENGGRIKNEPTIRNATEDELNKPYTCISFDPIYSSTGFGTKWKSAYADVMKKLLRTRAYQIAAYTRACVDFQDEKIPIQHPTHLALGYYYPVDIEPNSEESKMIETFEMNKNQTVSLKTGDYTNKYKLTVCIGPSKSNKLEQLSIINGVYVREGVHMDFLIDQIIEYITPKIEQYNNKTRLSKTHITNHLFMLVVGQINHAQFGSQTKDKIEGNSEQFAEYLFSESDLRRIWRLLEPYIVSGILAKQVPTTRKRMENRITNVPNFRDAECAGKKSTASKCSLVWVEGTSARGLWERGLSSERKETLEYTYDHYGIFEGKGVPINAVKKCRTITDPRTGKKLIHRNDQLTNNERFNALVRVLGLRYELTYKTQADRDKLRYGKLIITVDQDEDGKGNIFPLLIANLNLFWPELVKRDFIYRFNTPIKRIFSKKGKKIMAKSFYSLPEFEQWKTATNLTDAEFNKSWTVKYYKGLAEHSPKETYDMFKNLKDNLIEYYKEDDTDKYFDIYYGKHASLRKTELSNDPNIPDAKTNETILGLTYHLRKDGRSFQLYNIGRSLPHSLDGLNPSRRMVLYTAYKTSKNSANDAEYNVNSFGGVVKTSCKYSHGEASLNGTIISMGQEYPMSNVVPYLLGSSVSNFGSRKFGGKDAGAPRYLNLRINKALISNLIHPIDLQLLPYRFDGAKRCEPKYFIPAFPMSVVESICLPAHGWKIESWSRDIYELFEIVKRMIDGGNVYPDQCEHPEEWEIAISIPKWTGEFRYIKDIGLYSVGSYEYDSNSNCIIITELPLGAGINSTYFSYGNHAKELAKKEREKNNPKKKNTKKKKIHGNEHREDEEDEQPHSNALINKPFVESVDDRSNDERILIYVKLKENTYNKIQEHANDNFDGVEEYFTLRTRIHDCLNYINTDGVVKSYTSYCDIVRDWFTHRKQLYMDRHARMLLVYKLELELLENIQRYCKERNKLKITTNHTTEQVDTILSKANYIRLDKKIIKDPGFISNDELRNQAMFSDEISYDYIHDLRQYETHSGSVIKREKEIDKLKEHINELELDLKNNGFPGKTMWLNELTKLENIIIDGIENEWNKTANRIVFT